MKSLKLLLRFLIVGGLILLLMIPLLMVRGVISDRQNYEAQAVDRIARSMAGAQQVVGPLRVVPWEYTFAAEVKVDGELVKRMETRQGYVVQTPKLLTVGGDMQPSLRRIGLYDVRTYQWLASMDAQFDALTLEQVDGRRYGKPMLIMGVTDVRGLIGTPELKVDGQALNFESGAGAMSHQMSGVHANLDINGNLLPASNVQLGFTLAGTESLGISPVADSNRIDLKSQWPHPLFGGQFLPTRREITANGFSAHWEISSLASDALRQLSQRGDVDFTQRRARDREDSPALSDAASLGSSINTNIDSLDVHLVDPVNVYTQVDRASKYGILFVLLTFVGFALFELIKRLPIHPLQYLLVGLALAIFFLLLLSLSEHIAFWQAYLASALACIGLQFFYLSGVLKSWLRAAGFAGMLTTLYGVLYILLLSESNALLMGSLLLFGILALVMWVTRKVDWYDLSTTLR